MNDDTYTRERYAPVDCGGPPIDLPDPSDPPDYDAGWMRDVVTAALIGDPAGGATEKLANLIYDAWTGGSPRSNDIQNACVLIVKGDFVAAGEILRNALLDAEVSRWQIVDINGECEFDRHVADMLERAA